MHPLKQYLQDVEEPIQDFARRVGASRQTLYQIIGGNQAPKPALARRIVEATGGAVCFEALYLRGVSANAEIIGLGVKEDAALLDHNRIKIALAIVVNHLSPQDTQGPPDEAIEIAADAVVNMYSALSRVTTRQGPDRLQQALRPVLEEILREYSGLPPPSGALERGAELATKLYYQAQTLGRLHKSLP